MVAGTAPRARIMLSHSWATKRLDGRGKPWLIIVDSSATMGVPAAIAAETSAEYLIALFMGQP